MSRSAQRHQMIALVWHKYKPIQAWDFYWSEDCKFSVSAAQCNKHAPGIVSHGCSSLPLCPSSAHGSVQFWDSEGSLCTVCWRGLSQAPHPLLTALPLLPLLEALQERLRATLGTMSHLQWRKPQLPSKLGSVHFDSIQILPFFFSLLNLISTDYPFSSVLSSYRSTVLFHKDFPFALIFNS